MVAKASFFLPGSYGFSPSLPPPPLKKRLVSMIYQTASLELKMMGGKEGKGGSVSQWFLANVGWVSALLSSEDQGLLGSSIPPKIQPH